MNERKINICAGSCSVFSAADDPESERRRQQSTVVINCFIFKKISLLEVFKECVFIIKIKLFLMVYSSIFVDVIGFW